MKTAVIYARYSSDSQTEQSIEGQLRVCQQYAKNNDILIVDTYIDRAMTGTNDLRPDFQRMIKDSSKKQWDYVIVYKLDRFSRNKYETTIHKHTLSNNGVKVLSAMENIPDTPEGIILESLLEGMNQYYSAELSQKVNRGLKESYIKGQFTGGVQIYGYEVKDKKNYIHPVEGEIVKEIFDKYSKGVTAVLIAEDLKKRGIRTNSGKFITDKQIYKMIANTKYNGKVQHGDTVYTNIYPAIVDDDIWQRVQKIRNANKHAPGRKKEIYDFILSGKLICGDCKTMMVGESGTSSTGDKYYYYNCLSRRRKKSNCKFKAIHKQLLEDDIMAITWKLLCDSETITELAKQILKRHENATKQNINIKALTNKRDGLLKASNNLISAIEQGIITEQTKIRLKELEAQISQLDFDIEQEKQRTYSFLTQEKIEDYLKGVICGDIDDIGTRKKIVNQFIREIVVYEDKVVITYNFTDQNPITYKLQDDINEIEKQPKERAVIKKDFRSNITSGSPPQVNCTHPRENEKCVQFFFLHECFGAIIPFEKPKVDNAGWQNWKVQKRDKYGNFCK